VEGLKASVALMRSRKKPEPLEEYNLYWGEIHTHTNLSDGVGSPKENFEIARRHLDFWSMTDHAYDKEVCSRYSPKNNPEHINLNLRWNEIKELCRSYYAPGKFVPILGYEWTNFSQGHHNVYFKYPEKGEIVMKPTLPELYKALKGRESIVIPHHTGYGVGLCGKDWQYHDEKMNPFVEIYSLHGSSEEPNGIKPLLAPGSWMGPGASGGSVQEGLARGYKLGIMASSDSHTCFPGCYNHGFIAAYAKELTRGGLWEAFLNRRIYGITGDRILVDFRINNAPMGSVIKVNNIKKIYIKVIGDDVIDRIDIIKNGKIFYTYVGNEPGVVRETAAVQTLRLRIQWGWNIKKEKRNWEGILSIKNGKIRVFQTCFAGAIEDKKNSLIREEKKDYCRWTSTTRGNIFLKDDSESILFDIEGKLDSKLLLMMRTENFRKEKILTMREVLQRSYIEYLEDIPYTNDGSYWHRLKLPGKFKIHKGVLYKDLQKVLNIIDKKQEKKTDYYYVRILQKNGQVAWSSPIWVAYKC